MRIGCVPYLNAKPLIAWFHSRACDAEAEVIYAVPSELACQLRAGRLDVALVSTFELFRTPGLTLIPNISISADGPVKSVRLFSCVPFHNIECVAMDTGSLTSVALAKILLRERYGIDPECVPHSPDLDAMLAAYDAGLIIGDIKLFDTPATNVLDLGAAWKEWTGLPFVYAAWLARNSSNGALLTDVLTRAKEWGLTQLDVLAEEWAMRMTLPLDRVQDYFQHVMKYDLDPRKWEALLLFQRKCVEHGLVETTLPLRLVVT
ncbi:MAG TPA: menaquinone biosynthesis protein [Chthonomonadales bacterium]|nr:menaquinone biosynthesis protein [Chthonomonadales bacterium]